MSIATIFMEFRNGEQVDKIACLNFDTFFMIKGIYFMILVFMYFMIFLCIFIFLF